MRNFKLANSSKVFMCVTALLAGSACGGDSDEPTDGKTVMAPNGQAGQPNTGTDAPGESRYAVVTQVAAGGAMPTSYVSITPTLASSTPLSLDGALSVAGRSLVANLPGSGSFFVSNGAAELVKYTLDAADKPVEAGKIGFPGASSIGEYASQLQVVSDTKAYYFDTRTAQIFVWNPSTLAVVKTIPLAGLQVADATLTFSSTLPVKRAGKIALAAGWRSSNNQRVIKQVALVVLDTASDTATILRDDRCGYVRDAVEASDGRVYLATEAWGSAVHRLNAEFAPAPCLLRTDAALTAIDATFYKELNVIGGGVTGSLTASLDGKVYTRVLDEAAAGINVMTSARALASMPVWSWAELTLGDEPKATKVGAALGTGSMIVLETKDKRFVAEVKMAGTDLIDLTKGIGGVASSTMGNTFSLVQVR